MPDASSFPWPELMDWLGRSLEVLEDGSLGPQDRPYAASALELLEAVRSRIIRLVGAPQSHG